MFRTLATCGSIVVALFWLSRSISFMSVSAM
jgi:hypothetical protein